MRYFANNGADERQQRTAGLWEKAQHHQAGRADQETAAGQAGSEQSELRDYVAAMGRLGIAAITYPSSFYYSFTDNPGDYEANPTYLVTGWHIAAKKKSDATNNAGPRLGEKCSEGTNPTNETIVLPVNRFQSPISTAKRQSG